MTIPAERTSTPRKSENSRRSKAVRSMVEKASTRRKPKNMPAQEHKASAAATSITDKSRRLYARARRRCFPAFGRVGRVSARVLESVVADVLGQKEYTYQKGEGYPRVRIRGNGVVSVPLQELYGSTKARENLESMRKRMHEAMIRQVEREEANREEDEREAQRSRPNRPQRAATATKKRASPRKKAAG